jgi:chitin disaccharide deacetylase
MNIIINADDFGTSESVNNTILKLFEHGIVSSTTIIANSKFFNMAVDISRDNPRLGVGVHLCLDGPYNIGNHYESIINKSTNQFYDKPQITHRLKWVLTNESEMYEEYCMQIEKVLDHRIKISHIDHHHHLHLYIPALRSMIKAAKKYKIRYIRSQKIILHYNNNCLNKLYRNLHQLYLKSNCKAIDGFFQPGIDAEPNNDAHYKRFSRLLGMKNKIIEVVVHPLDENDPETRFLICRRTSQLLGNANIISYSDLK